MPGRGFGRASPMTPSPARSRRAQPATKCAAPDERTIGQRLLAMVCGGNSEVSEPGKNEPTPPTPRRVNGRRALSVFTIPVLPRRGTSRSGCGVSCRHCGPRCRAARRRPRLLGERRPLHAGRDEDERAGGRSTCSPSNSKRARPRWTGRGPRSRDPPTSWLAGDPARARKLVVLVEDSVTCVSARPRADTERGDAEVMPNGPQRTATVACLPRSRRRARPRGPSYGTFSCRCFVALAIRQFI